MRIANLVLLYGLLVMGLGTAHCQTQETIDLKELEVADGIERTLRVLKPGTDNFVELCGDLAKAIDSGIAAAEKEIAKQADIKPAKKLELLIAAVRGSGAERTGVEGVIRGIKPANPTRAAWTKAYNDILEAYVKKKNTFEAKRKAYQTASTILKGIKTDDNPLNSAVLDSERIADKVATTLRDDKKLELMKFDTEFQKTVNRLVSVISALQRSVDTSTISVEVYKKKTRDAVIEVFGQLDQATKTIEAWHLAYKMFEEQVAKSSTLDTTTADGWHNALTILVVGLKRAAGIESKIVEEGKKNLPTNRARGGASASRGGFTGGGYSNTWHGARTARRVSRILDRVQIQRARIYRFSRRN